MKIDEYKLDQISIADLKALYDFTDMNEFDGYLILKSIIRRKLETIKKSFIIKEEPIKTLADYDLEVQHLTKLLTYEAQRSATLQKVLEDIDKDPTNSVMISMATSGVLSAIAAKDMEDNNKLRRETILKNKNNEQESIID